MDQSMHSESKKIQQSHSKHSYFCSTKFICIPLASCIFPIDQLQLSNAALQGLKYIEDLLSQSEDPAKLLLLRHRAEAFFQRFGSHANQGPLHLGGIYWWKSISEGFQKEQLAEVKQQAAEALDIYIRGSYRGFGVNIGTDLDVSDSHSKKASQRTTFQNLQTKVQLSVAQTGGPPEANDFLDWKAGLVASNQTWCVIDRGLQLVPVWDIVLSSHRSDFKDPLKVANCLKDSYTVLTELTAKIQEGEELLSIEREARIFLEDVKSWKVFDPEEQLKRLINFMQRLSQKTESYTIWTNICLKDWGLQNFLVNTVNFCKKSSNYGTKFIKSQLRSLLDPHIYTVTNFPQAHSIMQWIFQSEPREDNVHITQFSELIEIFKKTQNDFREIKANSESTELVEEAQRKLTYEVSLSLRSFLKYLRETGKPDTHILLLLIASGAGYHVVHNIFQYLLGHDELDFLLDKMQTAQNKYQELKNICNYRAQAFLVLTGLTATVGIKAVSPEEKTQRLALIKHHMGHSLTKEVIYVLTKPEDHDWENLDKDLRLLIDGNYEAAVSSLQVEEVRKQLKSVFREKKDLHEPHNNENKKEEVIENGAFRDLLERLGLEHYYPRKMSRANFQLIHKTSDRFDNCLTFTNLHGDAKEHEKQLAFLQEVSSIIVVLMSTSDDNKGNRKIRHCKEAKEKAENLMTLLREMEIRQVKENLLPLQGKLWQRWCEKDRELYHLREKGNRSIEQHKSETETEKQMIRQEQLRKAFPVKALMCSVLEILQNHSETHTKLYFLQWLNVALDNLTAQHLENLNEKKKALVLKQKQEATNSSSLKDWQHEIEAISREINDCTLGIEHILRETGQIYEALEEASPMKDTLFLSLPHIAADLMISGVPIELMDGDVSHVPLRWVAAVFDKLSEKLGNKRLFVLSVLGLQSSGKSTLLNALFGLQFTVSAGRCTRGAYMQLLKVEETFTAELGFDFVLVVDTEGLRAPEFSNKSQNHDNELATFVIGLGNLTLINIMGENPSEMQDILQIVVQAFLRMKQVKISPSCLFVHQNVGEVTAKEETMEGRSRLEERLDKMAALAAEEEQCSDVTCFSDVIKFDVNTHVYYFAHLWDGNPPMAPPNPRYSHNVQELKSRILVTAQQESRGSIMKISDVKLRVQDLWRALLTENFIFSFRNTEEAMAMSNLETMYNSWTWELRSHVQSLQDELIIQIQNGKIQTLVTHTLEDPVREKYEAIKQELEKCFNDDPDIQKFIQWKGNFENKLNYLKEALITDNARKAEELISFKKKNHEKVDKKKSDYEKELLEKSQNLALSLNGTKSSEEELHEKFNLLWKKWVYDVSSSLPPATDPDIELDSENILLDYFKKEKDMVTILENYSGEKFEINYEKHVKTNKKYWGLPTMKIEPQDIHSINRTTDCIISKVNETVNKICQQKHDYNPTYFHEILRIIDEEVKSAHTQKRYAFTRRYEIDLSLCLFQRASVKFKEMHKAFKRANDPVNYLQSKKDDFFMSFKISYQGATSV
ncbi:hypothetical protein Celaphus_00009118, partial [Cervus elaphus hippelaphus]